MYTIDLLKGQGIPEKPKPQGIALLAMTFAVPAVMAIFLFGYYLRNSVIIEIKNQNIKSYDAKMEKLSTAVELRRSFESEKGQINSCLAEVGRTIGRHVQWSGILTALVENIPDSVILTKLEVKDTSVKKKVPIDGDSKKMVEKNVAVKALKMSVSGRSNSNCDRDVKTFRDRLRFSDTLGPKLQDVVIVSQGFGTLDDDDVVSYEIECIFKPEI